MAKRAYLIHEATQRGPLSGMLVILWHGAGGDVDQAHIVGLAKSLPELGATVARARFPYRAAGKKAPDRMPKLIESAKSTIEKVTKKLDRPPKRLVLGGRSMGGRMTTMLAAEGYDVDGLLLLSYPLHPAGNKEKLRDAHLPSVRAPMLYLQGSKDALCDLALLRPVLKKLKKRATLEVFEGADHSARKIPVDTMNEIVAEWLTSRAS